MTSTQLRRTFAAVVVAVAVVITATAASAAPGRHVSNAKQQVDLSGVTLHAGDQLEILRTQLEASGEDQDVPYDIEWSTFVGGPAVLAAQTGGSVDVGFMAETPLVFAQAAGNPVKVVAASQVVDPKTSGFALVVPPDSDITKLSQLKGKKIGYSTGTITQYFLLNALKKAGLDFTDVAGDQLHRSRRPGGVRERRRRRRGHLGAVPLRAAHRQEGAHPRHRRRAHARVHVPRRPRRRAAKDKKTSAALSDFVARVARAQKWWGEHPEEVAKANEETFKLSPKPHWPRPSGPRRSTCRSTTRSSPRSRRSRTRSSGSG